MKLLSIKVRKNVKKINMKTNKSKFDLADEDE